MLCSYLVHALAIGSSFQGYGGMEGLDWILNPIPHLEKDWIQIAWVPSFHWYPKAIKAGLANPPFLLCFLIPWDWIGNLMPSIPHGEPNTPFEMIFNNSGQRPESLTCSWVNRVLQFWRTFIYPATDVSCPNNE